MKTKIKDALFGFAAICFVFIVGGLLVYGGFKSSRWLNYSMAYEQMVTDTVCKMVRTEHLINQKDCK